MTTRGAQQPVLTEIAPRAEICQEGNHTWRAHVADQAWADGLPLWLDLGTCFTERGAVRAARRWVRRANQKRAWKATRREVTP